MADHDSSLRPYVLVLLALFALTSLTVGAAYVDMGDVLNNLVAFGIAATKASLVVMFFMHVKGSTSLIKLTAVGGFFWLVILFTFILADILMRTTLVPGWH